MFKKVYLKSLRTVCAIVAGGLTAVSAMADDAPVFLGPANPGAESGLAKWRLTTIGGGSASIDNDDPASGGNDFCIANAVPGLKNHTDLRSESFSLKHTGKAGAPLTVSFAYKLPGKVKSGDNIALHLLFIEQTDMHLRILGEKKILVGSSTADSEMTQYKTMTVANIYPPANALSADIWITANISEPWSSGAAQFDDISVTTAPAQSWATLFGALTTLLTGTLYVRHSRKRQTVIMETSPESSSLPARV